MAYIILLQARASRARHASSGLGWRHLARFPFNTSVTHSVIMIVHTHTLDYSRHGSDSTHGQHSHSTPALLWSSFKCAASSSASSNADASSSFSFLFFFFWKVVVLQDGPVFCAPFTFYLSSCWDVGANLDERAGLGDESELEVVMRSNPPGQDATRFNRDIS